MKRFLAIARKELIHIRRDPQTLALVFLMPLVMLLMYGYAIRLDVKNIALVVRDLDRSAVSRDLLAALQGNAAFELRGPVTSSAEAERALTTGRAKVALTIPRGFGRTGEAVQLLIDGSEPTSGVLAMSYLTALLTAHAPRAPAPVAATAAAAGQLLAPPRIQTRVWYNPEEKSSHFIVPGLVAILMMMLCALLTAITMSREFERGTFELVFVSPATRGEVVFGKVLAYVGLGFLVAAVTLLFGHVVFGVPVHGSLLLLGSMMLIYAFAALGIGVFISTVARSQRAAMLGAMLATILPSVFLSGFVFPIRSMPLALQVLCWFVPARHFLVIVRGILLKGIGLAHLWTSAVYLLGLGGVFVVASILRFQRRIV